MSHAQGFGERLAQERREKAARDRRDITQRDVAKAVNLTSAAISRYEAGDVIPNDDILARLAAYYGIRPSWLRYGEGEKYPPSSTEIETTRPEPTERPSVAAGGARRPRKR